MKADREVLFVVGLPPEDGQPICRCHKAYDGGPGDDRLTDGAIYVRDHRNTRARECRRDPGGRGTGPRPPITFDIGLLGCISRVDRVAEVLDRLV